MRWTDCGDDPNRVGGEEDDYPPMPGSMNNPEPDDAWKDRRYSGDLLADCDSVMAEVDDDPDVQPVVPAPSVMRSVASDFNDIFGKQAARDMDMAGTVSGGWYGW